MVICSFPGCDNPIKGKRFFVCSHTKEYFKGKNDDNSSKICYECVYEYYNAFNNEYKKMKSNNIKLPQLNKHNCVFCANIDSTKHVKTTVNDVTKIQAIYNIVKLSRKKKDTNNKKNTYSIYNFISNLIGKSDNEDTRSDISTINFVSDSDNNKSITDNESTINTDPITDTPIKTFKKRCKELLRSYISPCCNTSFTEYSGCFTIKCDLIKKNNEMCTKYFCGACFEIINDKKYDNPHDHISKGDCEIWTNPEENFGHTNDVEHFLKMYKIYRVLLYVIKERHDNSIPFGVRKDIIMNMIQDNREYYNVLDNMFYTMVNPTEDLEGINRKLYLKMYIFKSWKLLIKEKYYKISDKEGGVDNIKGFVLKDFDNIFKEAIWYKYVRRYIIPPKKVWDNCNEAEKLTVKEYNFFNEKYYV